MTIIVMIDVEAIVPEPRCRVLADVLEERERQVERWGEAHDDVHTPAYLGCDPHRTGR